MDGNIGTNGYVANEMYDRMNYGGRNNGGGLYTGNSVLAAGVHADGTAVSAKLDCNAAKTSDNIAGVARQFESGERNAQFNRLNENISDNEFRTDARLTGIGKDISDSEFRTIDRNRDIERLVVEGQKENASCCCDTQKQLAAGFASVELEGAKNHGALLLKMCEDKNELSKQMAEGFSNIKDRELNSANNKITQLETINAINNNDHHHYPRP